MKKIKVNLPGKQYNIIIEKGGLKEIGSSLKKHKGISKKGMLVTNRKVFKLFGEEVLNSLSTAGFQIKVIKVPDSEQAKSIKVASECYTKMIKFGLNRNSFMIALGGGVVGDLTGFLAATYMRGIKYFQCPTTLLSQVDSSVGGKTAVNLPEGKNLVGCFYQPSLVIADLQALKTLPVKEYKDGLSEVVKYAFINDRTFFNFLVKNISGIKKRETAILEKIVATSVKNKAFVVEQDEKEKGLRAILNFGHTFGHAIEKTYSYKGFSHGQAVAAGMYMGISASVAKGILKEPDAEKMISLLDRLELRYTVRKDAEKSILKNFSYDKKMTDKGLLFILLEAIGKSTQQSLDYGLLKNTIRKFIEEKQ